MKVRTVFEIPVISIIDDDESVRTAIGSLIRSIGFEIRIFGSAREFLVSDSITTSACVISDVQMPDMSGLELLALFNTEDNPPPIIFMTALPLDNLRQRTLRAGAICFLSKPFEGQTLIDCIESALKHPPRDH